VFADVLLKVNSYCGENMICDVERFQTNCIVSQGLICQY